MCVQVVHDEQEHVYGVDAVVPTVVPFSDVEKHVFGEVHAVPHTVTPTCCTICPLPHGSLNVQQLWNDGQSYQPFVLQMPHGAFTFQQSTTSVVERHVRPHPSTGVGASVSVTVYVCVLVNVIVGDAVRVAEIVFVFQGVQLRVIVRGQVIVGVGLWGTTQHSVISIRSRHIWSAAQGV